MSRSPQLGSRVSYRPDIDGLRAVAVLLVLASHLKISPQGGYIGVDVFFVISGYLISSSISMELNQGSFSLLSFYERRVRRIFPALMAMLAVVTGLATAYLFPAELLSYAKSLLAALVSCSNIWFWKTGSYSDPTGVIKPLLHTWSLGVEEQFYLVFPILLAFLHRRIPKLLRPTLCFIAAATFAYASVRVRAHANAVFFSAPMRAWELLLGVIVSQLRAPLLRIRLSREVAAAAGLLLILIPAFLYTPETVFPGLTALPPGLGAALLIAAGETGSSAVGSLLSWRPIVFIGLISYSLYLWHWPVIVFAYAANWAAAVPNRFLLNLLLAGLSILLAALSWKFIEQPFRVPGPHRPGRRRLFQAAFAATLMIAACAATLIHARGLPQRFSPAVQNIATYIDYPSFPPYRAGTCFLTAGNRFSDFPASACLLPQDTPDSILILGDSHAAMLWPGLSTVFHDRPIAQATVAACAPLLGQQTRHVFATCSQLADLIYLHYLPEHPHGTVLLAANWTPGDLPAIRETVRFGHDHNLHLILVGPGPQYDLSAARLIAMSLRNHPQRWDAGHEDPTRRPLDHQMAALARSEWHIPYISVFDTLCPTACPAVDEQGVPIIWDSGHFTAEGSIFFARLLKARNQLTP